MTDILVVDSDPLIRRGVISVLDCHLPNAAFLEASDAPEAVAALTTHRCDLVLLELGLPGMPGMALLSAIRALTPALPVLVVTSHPERSFAVCALRAGAAGYLVKGGAVESLVGAVREVLAGRLYITPTIGGLLADEVVGVKPKHQVLSARELAVFMGLASGRPISAIAADLRVSVKTINTYRTRIILKTGLRTNMEMTQYALRQDLTNLLVSPDPSAIQDTRFSSRRPSVERRHIEAPEPGSLSRGTWYSPDLSNITA